MSLQPRERHNANNDPKNSQNRRRHVATPSTLGSSNSHAIPSGYFSQPATAAAVVRSRTPSFTNFLPKSVSSSVGPVSLVGGTAVIYSSLLHHPSSTLNQLSFVLMMLLAVQYAIQPRLSKKYIHPNIQKQSVALVEEVVKTGFATAIFFSKPTSEVNFALKDWSISSSVACAGLPAMLYALQGVLQYISYQHLDPVTFNGLTQTKTLSAALCCWWIMNKAQSPLQMFALGILSISALVFQGYIKIELFWKKTATAMTTQHINTESNRGGSSVAAAPTRLKLRQRSKASTISPTSRSRKIDDWWWCGVAPCLGAAFLSGLAGALSQKGLQLTGIKGRDPFLYTMEISLFSAITLLVHMARSNVFSNLEWQKQRQYWNRKTLIPIVLKASSGVITALVHKYAGSVSKGFALMFGLVLSNMIQLTRKQENLQSYQVLGTVMIMLSTWLHFTNPP